MTDVRRKYQRRVTHPRRFRMPDSVKFILMNAALGAAIFLAYWFR